MLGRKLVPHLTCWLPAACLVLGSLACDFHSTEPDIPRSPRGVVPPLEPVPFDALGSGKIVFERIGGAGGQYDGVYLIDAARRTSVSILDSVSSPWIQGPSISPSGDRIAWTRFDRALNPAVYVTDFSGAQLRQVSPKSAGCVNSSPSWTPTGSGVVYGVEGHLCDGVDPTGIYERILATDAVTTLRSVVTEPDPLLVCSIEFPPVSVTTSGSVAIACGGTIYGATSPDAPLEALYAPDSTQTAPYYAAAFSPVWSSTGNEIAFLEVLRWGREEKDDSVFSTSVKLLEPASGTVHTLATIPGSGGQPYLTRNWFSVCWLPGDTALVFNAPITGVSGIGPLLAHLWVVSAKGGEPTQLTTAPDAFDHAVSCSR